MAAGSSYAIETARVLREAGWRRAGARVINFVVISVSVASLALLACAIVMAVLVLPEILAGEHAADIRGMEAGEAAGEIIGSIIGEVMERVILLMAVMAYTGIYIVPLVLTLPVTGPLVALWSDPARFLLLRPFNRGTLTRPLKRVVRRELGPLGHVYTLSDADMHVPWYVRVPLLLGQIALFSFRIRKVRSLAKIPRLERALERVWLRNINWCLTYNKVFAVASDDACWQPVVRSMVARMDAIVIDATKLSPNVLWEVELCRSLGSANRVLFLVDEDEQEEALGELRAAFPELSEEEYVFVYSEKGLCETRRFREKVAKLVAHRNVERGGGARNRGFRLLAFAAMILFAAQIGPLFALSFWWGIPFIPSWTDWRDKPTWPGLAALVNAPALAVALIGVLTLALLLYAARRHRTIYFLVAIQALALLVASLPLIPWW